jgi:hypothetical protein
MDSLRAKVMAATLEPDLDDGESDSERGSSAVSTFSAVSLVRNSQSSSHAFHTPVNNAIQIPRSRKKSDESVQLFFSPTPGSIPCGFIAMDGDTWVSMVGATRSRPRVCAPEICLECKRVALDLRC